MTLELPDKPGQLSEVTRIIAAQGANVMSVLHERSTTSANVNSCTLHVEMETRNNEHISEIRKALQNEGITVREQ